MQDLQSPTLTKLSWDGKQRADSLQAVFSHVTGSATTAVNWYYQKKRWKKRFAIYLRFLVVPVTSAGGLIPIVSELWVDANGQPIVSPLWSTLAFGIAALLLAYDRFFSLSMGWIRYVTTAMQINTRLDQFRLAWESNRATWGDKTEEPTAEQAVAALRMCADFTAEVNKQVQQETDQWAADFARVLRQLEKAVQTARQTTKPPKS